MDLVKHGRILLVDDDHVIRIAYARALEQDGYLVEKMSDGRHVAEALATGSFDAVISDIAMPEISGIDVLRTVRAYDPDLPVVLMTGRGELDTAMAAVEHGALRYLLKPLDIDHLSRAAAEAVEHRRLARVRREAIALYDRAAQAKYEQELLGRRFDRALETLQMAFQPIVRLSPQDVFAYEALVRNDEPSLRRPDHLFNAAEQLGRLHELGRTIRSRVASALGAPGAPACAFVNLHPKDLEDPELFSPDAPLSLLADRVVLEVTERAPLEGMDLTQRLGALRELGFRLALDDLGSGYAGLSAFAQLRPEVVKLDMSLIRGISKDPTKQRLVKHMLGLCTELRIDVVCEGVELPEERDTLLSLGAELMQGYLFAKPAAPWIRVVWSS